MNSRSQTIGAQSQLVLSLFPGIDLFGRGFEAEGFCVVRGPDLIYGQDIRSFKPIAGRFDGVIAGPPCPDFSKARRGPSSGYGLEMLAEFRRCVIESKPIWWLIENVPGCPDVKIDAYSFQRLDIDARDVGLPQRRLRHFQFGHRDGLLLCVSRGATARMSNTGATCLASEGRKTNRRDWTSFCLLQGVPGLELPGMTLSARYRAVGNGVALPVARLLARAIISPAGHRTRLCECGCARPIEGRRVTAGAACRKRLQRQRDSAGVPGPDLVTPSRSQS